MTRPRAQPLSRHGGNAPSALTRLDLVDFLLGTGLRIGEACAIRWDAVDVVGGVLEVNSTMLRTKEHGLVIQERPKTAAGWRVLALPETTVVMLRDRMPDVPEVGSVALRSPLGQLRDRSNTIADVSSGSGSGRVQVGHVPHVPQRPSRPGSTTPGSARFGRSPTTSAMLVHP
jgi:integrase